MLKRISTYLLTAILMVATIGVNVSVQYCYGEYMGISINGIQFLSEIGEEMTCCQDDQGGCDGCKHTTHQYQIQSQYMGGQSVNVLPLLSSSDWMQGYFLEVPPYLITVEEDGGSEAGFYTPPPCYDSFVLLQHGLRAPPAWA